MQVVKLLKLILITFVLVCAPFSQVLAEQLAFSDVPVTHPQYEAIVSLQAAGVLSGYEDGTFKPERIVTRAEMVKLALRGAGITVAEKATETDFKDVAADSWYAPYIKKAAELKIVGGYEDGTFRPENSVNRVEALKMILTAQELEMPQAGEQIYTDVAVDSWYAPYVRFVYEHQLLTVDSEVFERDKGMTRKDIAEILYKLNLLKGAQTLYCWPLKMLISLSFLWILLLTLNIRKLRQNTFSKVYLHYLFAIFLAPFAALFYAVKSFSFELQNKQEKELNFRPSKYERFNYMFRRYVYTKKSAHLSKLLILFLKTNYLKVLYFFLVLLLDYFVYLLILTSLLSCSYKASFGAL
ncbi:MAG: S-layer homology domain-containing protein [Candidatus Gracilibacteria bacterium]|nr:S-layer homology domain-containing protein [Candidatus Gracilibacteria bacterium]